MTISIRGQLGFLSIGAILAVVACQGLFEEREPCDDVFCSGHGDCWDNGENAECRCDHGYVANGTECLLIDEADADADADADVDSDVDSDSDGDLNGDVHPLCESPRGGECNAVEQCGCPREHSCIISFETTSEVCTPGEALGGQHGDECETRPCGQGHVCVNRGSRVCVGLCIEDSDCPADSYCELELTDLEPYVACS